MRNPSRIMESKEEKGGIMKKIVMCLLCLCLVVYATQYMNFLPTEEQNIECQKPEITARINWETIDAPSINADRLLHATVYNPDADKIYMIGGTPDGYASSGVNYIYAYDAVFDSWNTSLNPMPTARSWISGAYWNGKIYVIGGWNTSGVAIDNNEAYDVNGDSWSTLAPIPQARYAHGTVAHDGNIYVIGGTDGATGFTTVYRYDINGNSWSTATSLPQAWDMGGCTIWDNVIYLCGGYNRNDTLTYSHLYSGTIDAGNPDNITWDQLEALPDLIGNCGATALNGNIYMLGGFIEDERTASAYFYVFLVTMSMWVQLMDFVLPITRNHFVVARQGHNEIYSVAGDANGDWITPNNYYYKNQDPIGILESSNIPDIQETNLSVYPSIGNRIFTISFFLPSSSPVYLTLHNVLGQKVMSLYEGNVTNHSLNLSSENFSPGIYFVNLRTIQTNITQKLIVTK
jgi:N-acetylneuraminic acid mutarotase